jgi:o-succinylbenzoate synthase
MNRTIPRLERVDANRVSVPFSRPFETAAGVFTTRSSWILELRALDGQTGFGEVALDPAASAGDEAELGAAVRAALPMLVRGRLTVPEPMTPIWTAVWAGVDGAMEWLRAQGSVHANAGGTPATSVAVSATIGFMGREAGVREAATAVASGFSCLKVKAGPKADAAGLAHRLRAIRAEVGPAVHIRLDANASWDFATASDMLPALVELDLEYVEQPLAAWDLAGHASLRRMRIVPIALDESIDSLASAASAFALGAADVLVVKPARVGGPTAAGAIASQAASHNIPVVLSTFFETGIGLVAGLRAAAALPPAGGERAHGLGTAGILAHDLLAAPLPLERGRMAIPLRPVVDEEALARFTVEKSGAAS